MKKYNKVVLAYSGGLDTSIIISWLKETYGCEVIAVVGNVGQKDELLGLEEKALKTGASKCYIEDLNKEFVEDYIFPTIQANAIYEGKYLLGTSFARPIIAKRLVEIALAEGADAICHGCTGKGNDQVRFELAVKAFAPDMEIIAPWRIWDIKSREEEIKYALDREIPISISYETNYSKDKNLWHLSHEGLDLEDPANEPNYEKILELSNTLEKALDVPTYITLKFEKGIPVALNGEELDGPTLIEKLNKIGGENAIGIMDMVENRLVGMKSRGVYETPGGSILYKAHKDLEELCLDKETSHYKEIIALKFAELPLGSGALATSTYNLDRHMIAKDLGFAQITVNSLDSVSDRDYVIEALSVLSMIMMHLSRFSEEIILWATNEFSFIELSDEYSTGSSIMPQKKNPDVAELVRGKTGRVYGDLITLLTVMKGLPLAYNKDMQEDKEALFDALDTASLSLKTFAGMLDTLKINKDNMRKGASLGFINATDVADYLVKKGLAFRTAHEIVGAIVLNCIKENIAIDDLTLEEFKAFSPIFEEDIYEAIDLVNCVEERKVFGGPSSSSVKTQLQLLLESINKTKEAIKCLK